MSKGCYEVRGKTLGIVGYGHIGSQVGVLAEMLGMKVKFFDIASKVIFLKPETLRVKPPLPMCAQHTCSATIYKDWPGLDLKQVKSADITRNVSTTCPLDFSAPSSASIHKGLGSVLQLQSPDTASRTKPSHRYHQALGALH